MHPIGAGWIDSGTRKVRACFTAKEQFGGRWLAEGGFDLTGRGAWCGAGGRADRLPSAVRMGVMPFVDPGQSAVIEIFPGVTIRAVWGEHLMMSFVHFQRAGASVPAHSHPHEQMGMGLEGKFELVIAGESRTVRPGDCYLVPGGVQHSARSIDGPARALDIFHPVREEYKGVSP